MRRLLSKPITPGQRLPFDVFYDDETLMLLRGTPIKSAHDAEDIRLKGYFKPLQESRNSLFMSFTRLADRLGHIFEDLCESRQNGCFTKRVEILANEFIELCDRDPDACFASVHLNIHHSYFVVHSMMAAIVCCRLALASRCARDQRLSLVCAALTHDIGLLTMSDLINSKDDLNDKEWGRIKQHVLRGVDMLKAQGVSDPLWLEAVGNHHEYLDGSGYHGKIELNLMVRILALADSYSAMLRPRPYRDRVIARQALESLISDQLHRYDGYLIEYLIWDLGFYPPGSVLRLRTNEMAVAIRNSPGVLDGPQVACFTDAQGHQLQNPVFRNSNEPKYAVVDVLDPALAARMGRLIDKCWAG